MSDDLYQTPMENASPQTPVAQPAQAPIAEQVKPAGTFKTVISTILVCIIVGILGAIVFWYFTNHQNNVSNTIVNESVVQPQNQVPVKEVKSGVETTQVDSTWNKYTNYDLGISFNYPNFTTVMQDQSYGKPGASRICINMKDRSKSYGDCDLSVVVGNNAKTDSEIISFFNKALSNSDITYNCSKISEKTTTDQEGVVAVDIAAISPDEMTETNNCFLNWVFKLLSRQQTGQIAYWQIGQDVKIQQGTQSYDFDIVKSFRFLD